MSNSRATDPATSVEAGATMTGAVVNDQQRLVLDALDLLHGTFGVTAWEVVRWSGHNLQQNVIAKRCTELRELGLIVDSGHTRPGSSGRRLICWTVTDAGRAALREVEA